jgi:hypothetical protein
MFRKLAVSLIALSLAASPALAGTSTLAVTPGSGVTYQVITQAGGNFVGMFGLCDGVAAAQCVAVKPASTAALATDPSVVVTISPNTATMPVSGTFWQTTQPVSGTFWQATQPISAASLPLPTGASTAAGLTTINTTLGSPFQAGGSIANTSFAATQATAASLNATVVGTGTFTVQAAATLNAETTKVIGTVRNLGNAGAITDFAGQNASSPANAWLIGGQFNTTPTTITSGNASPFQLDNAGNLLVNVKAGGGSGGTSSSFSATFPSTGTAEGAEYLSSPPTLTTGQMVALQVTSAGSLHTTVDNANANGQTTASASSPTVLASDQKVADPCMFQAKTKVAFSTTSGSTQLVALSGSTKIYVCAVHFISTSADSISFTEGTGTACATGATAVSGSTTAASGMDFPANGGMTEGGGVGTVMNTSVAGDELCLLQSGTTKIAGNLEVVQQ